MKKNLQIEGEKKKKNGLESDHEGSSEVRMACQGDPHYGEGEYDLYDEKGEITFFGAESKQLVS